MMMNELLRPDFAQIVKWIPAECRLLDIGCGDGRLMQILHDTKGVRVQGIEIESNKVLQAIDKGLSVIQGDANTDLRDFSTNSFDVVVLSQTLQTLQKPRLTVKELKRIASKIVISTPNFAYWRGIIQLIVYGRMPMTRHLPATWYYTHNIHLCTLSDALDLLYLEGLNVLESMCFNVELCPKLWPVKSIKARLLAIQGLFLCEKSIVND